MPVESDPKDLVASPTTAADPSPAAPTIPAATPEPSGGVPAAPPAASDKASATPPAPAAEPTIKPLGDGDALDRLTAPTEKPKENTPAPVDAPAAKAADVDTENKDAPPEPAEGEEVPFKKADAKELAGYHSRTRHRITQFQNRIEQLEPAAKFTYDLAQAAAQRELKFESVVRWQELGFGLRDGDPEAIEALKSIVESHYTAQGKKLAPEPAAPDVAPLETVINTAFQSLDITEATKNQLLAAVAKIKAPAPVAQPVQQPRPQPVQRPQRPQPTEMDQTVAYVRNEEVQLAQRVGAAKWPEVRKAIYAEAARREASLPINRLNDPIDMRIRFAACAEHVLAKASQQAAAKPSTVPVQPSLRATPSPAPIPVPKRGTPEYDDYVLTHGIPAQS